MIHCRYRILLIEKERRDDRRWTQKDVSEATGISMFALSQYARSASNRYAARTVVRLCNFFQCGIGELLVREGGAASPGPTVLLDEPAISDEEPTHITICCGWKEEGRRRKWALEQLADSREFLFRRKPSIGRMVVAVANLQLAASGSSRDTDTVTLPAASSATDVNDARGWTHKTAIASRFEELLARKQAQDYQHRWSLRGVIEATGLSWDTLTSFRQERMTGFGTTALEALCGFFDCEVSDLVYLVGDDG